MARKTTGERVDRALETRNALLAAGVQILLDSPALPPIDQIRSTEVSRAAGVTHGAFYHHWESQDDYRDELVAHVLGAERARQEVEVFLEMAREAGSDESATGVEIVRRIANAGQDFNVALPSSRLNYSFLCSQRPDALELIHEQYDGFVEVLGQFYETLAEQLALRFRPPWTKDRFVVAILALVDGLTLRSLVGDGVLADDVDPDTGDEWRVLATAVLTLALGALERDDGGDPTSFFQAARDLLDRRSGEER